MTERNFPKDVDSEAKRVMQDLINAAYKMGENGDVWREILGKIPPKPEGMMVEGSVFGEYHFISEDRKEGLTFSPFGEAGKTIFWEKQEKKEKENLLIEILIFAGSFSKKPGIKIRNYFFSDLKKGNIADLKFSGSFERSTEVSITSNKGAMLTTTIRGELPKHKVVQKEEALSKVLFPYERVSS